MALFFTNPYLDNQPALTISRIHKKLVWFEELVSSESLSDHVVVST